MSAPTQGSEAAAPEVTNAGPPEHQPYIPDEVVIPEFTWGPLVVGALLGIVFGASSLYLLLKVGMTVSASVPIAVLSITLFRAFSKWFKIRQATILENNIVQTAGSAGESLAFGVGVTMPALLLLGFEMSWERVMTVAVLGGLLGILMMIPLRRAFIVKQHGKLKYPEGTACAEVLVAGERGGASARMVFIGFGIAFLHKFLTKGLKLWADEPTQNLYSGEGTEKVGLKGAAVGGELAPEMLGVGYLIGPRIACMMMAGAILSFWVIGPLIATFGEGLDRPVPPARTKIVKDEETGEAKNAGLIRNMGPGEIYQNYLRYIGAGAVAAGGIISMCRALPLILASIVSGVRDLRASGAGERATARTERDLPMTVVLFGSLGLVVALAAIPQLGLGLSLQGILGAVMILLFGFLFVTVSSRLTGEVGSSSNPISGMTIATLLLTCLVFVVAGRRDATAWLTAMSVAAVVCIASSNGGTTSQDLKTGYLVGATPKYQQYAILLGALTSALVIGVTMIALNAGGTHYTKRGFPKVKVAAEDIAADARPQKVGRPYEEKDDREYRVVHIREDREHQQRYPDVPPGRYLIDDEDRLTYRASLPIERKRKEAMDNPDDPTKEGEQAPEHFKAPQPELFALIIKGILGGNLEWALVIAGALIAVTMELMGVSALPVAVGMYLGLGTATPIFFGGLIRWLTDRWRGVSASEAETETSPGVLLSSGYIAGGTLCGLLLGFAAMASENARKLVTEGIFGEKYADAPTAKLLAVAAFLVLAVILFQVGSRKEPIVEGGPMPGELPNSGAEFPRQATGDERP
jgi:putative OPT family oligopeptide transporter